jgi:hypothetical protein
MGNGDSRQIAEKLLVQLKIIKEKKPFSFVARIMQN